MEAMIKQRNYAGIRSLLSAPPSRITKKPLINTDKNGNQINLTDPQLLLARANRAYNMNVVRLDGGRFIKFTALEWAIYIGDKKMATLFFAHGADPKHNVFNGVIRPPTVSDGFDPMNPQPIKSYAGLQLLVNKTDLVFKALLRFMERLHSGPISLEENYETLAQCLDVLSDDLRYSRSDLRSFVMTSLLSLRRTGLPNEVALPIVESALLGHLWSLLESYATRGLPAL